MLCNLIGASCVAVALLTGCGGGDDAGGGRAAPAGSGSTADTARTSAGTRFPDIRAAKLRAGTDGTFALDVTVSSPYDTPQRYADGWRVLVGGTQRVLGTHTLDHDHADEQPFTRTQDALEIPRGIARVTVQGRDRKNGYGGTTVTVAVPAG